MNPRWELAWPSRPAGGAARGAGPLGPRTAFVLSGGGNQGVSQVGMLRALLERDIVPDVVIGTSAGALNGAGDLLRPEPHRGRAARRGVGAAPQRPRVPRRQDPPRVERRAPRHPPLRERGTRGADPPQLAGALVLRPRDPAAGDRHRPRHRRGGRARPRPAQARAAREHRAARRVPDRAPRRPPPRRRRSRRQRPALARARRPGRPRVRAERLVGHVRARGALAARRGDDELHARAQPALRARAPVRAARDRGDRRSPARPTRATCSTSRARAS